MASTATILAFHIHLEEENTLLDFLQESGSVCAYAFEEVAEKSVQSMPATTFIETTNPALMYITLEEFSKEIKLRTVREKVDGIVKQSYAIDPFPSPVILSKRPRITPAGGLAPASFSYYKQFFDKHDRSCRKDSSFIRWADKIYSWVRKFTPEYIDKPGFRASVRVMRDNQSGKLQVVAY